MKRTKPLRPFLVAALAAGLVACATATPYGPSDGQYGYSEQRIEEDRFRVTFSGNHSTRRETVETFLLYRAAELTVAQGYDYFIATEQETEAASTYHTRPVFYGHYGHRTRGFPYYAYGFSWIHEERTSELRRYEAVAFIVMRAGEKPEDDPTAYDARDVLTNLGPVVEASLPS